MKLSDYVIDFLAQRGVTHVFGMSGGAAVHLFDSVDRHPKLDYVCSQHEQCAAMSADGYARVTGRLGVAMTTSGPGATNLLTGTCCSYFDSVPTLMLTGQVATHRLSGDRAIRQMGFQETDVAVDLRLGDEVCRAGPGSAPDPPSPRRGLVLGLRRPARPGADRHARRSAARGDRSRRPVPVRADRGRPAHGAGWRAISTLAKLVAPRNGRCWCSAAVSARRVSAPGSMR